jgi:hypothetical protein
VIALEPDSENQKQMTARDRSPLVGVDKDPVPSATILKTNELEKKLKGGYKVVYRAGSKRITILRFLLAKMVYDSDGLGLDEFLVVYDLFMYADGKSANDQTFREKYGDWLFTVSELLQQMSDCRTFPIRPNRESRELLGKGLNPLLPSQHAYFGYKKQPRISNSFRIQFRNPLITPKAYPPKRFIGVGYRDKGHLKNKAVDGSPSWQEVWDSKKHQIQESTLFLSIELQPKINLNRIEFVDENF